MLESLSVSDMESHSHENEPFHSADALQAAREAQERLAERVRSPWWFHVLRGLLVAALVIGLTGGPTASPWLLLGVVGLAALARRRIRTIGVTRANTERWRFLTTGAPWSLLAFIVTVLGMASVVVFRDLAFWQATVIAGTAAILVAALGPAADRAARQRMMAAPA